MNKQLIKFIKLCLVDGVISEKERGVLPQPNFGQKKEP